MPKAQGQLFVTKAPPWTQAKQAALRAQDETLIWLLIGVTTRRRDG